MDKNILDPYKTIGTFVHGPIALSKSTPFSFAAASYNSFKIYSDELAIKMVSPCFDSAIICLHTFNQFTYVCTKQKLYKIKYHHVIRQWALPKSNSKAYDSSSILVFEKVIFLGLLDTIYSISQEKTSQCSQGFETSINIGIFFKQILHPVTYINKLIAYSQDSIILFNPVSSKILFNYNTTLKELLKQNNRIAKLSVTPLIDIVAVCLEQGEIVILNLRTSKIIFVMKQKRTVTAIAFSETDSFMATADSLGNIILWDLENKKIVYRLESAVTGPIDSLFFVPGYQLLTTTSSIANSIKQFRINLDDNKTLLQYRQRSGCSSKYPIIGLKCQNNKQITFSTENMTVFSSLYSHSNMYSLPFCLDSQLPYHIVSKNFTVQLYRERTLISKINIHENAHIAKISISKKFAIIGTKNRIIKIAIPSGSNPTTSLVICLEWKVQNPQQIILQNERFIFVACQYGIIALNFSQSTVASLLNENDECVNLISNRSQTMLAFENRTKKSIQIWDMRFLSICRQYKEKKGVPTTRLCFSSDNKYLLSSHEDQTVAVWSILQNTLYKTVMMENKIVEMCFTPDNSYLLTVFENSKQINIWHNYIGKITSSQIQNSVLKFSTPLNYLLEEDYRSRLTEKRGYQQQITTEEGNELNSLLDELQDEKDLSIQNYQFESYSRWMPLVYYDQIKKRNSISNEEDQTLPSLPFFLDFKNLSQEQQKINNQMKQQTIKKRNQQRQKIDSQLKNSLHQIKLNEKSTSQEYIQTWKVLSTINVAEVDYQIRRYLLLPGHAKYILKMLNQVFEAKQKVNQMILNIIIVRVLDLAGSQICSMECKEQTKKLLFEIRRILESEQNVIERCLAISSQV